MGESLVGCHVGCQPGCPTLGGSFCFVLFLLCLPSCLLEAPPVALLSCLIIIEFIQEKGTGKVQARYCRRRHRLAFKQGRPCASASASEWPAGAAARTAWRRAGRKAARWGGCPSAFICCGDTCPRTNMQCTVCRPEHHPPSHQYIPRQAALAAGQAACLPHELGVFSALRGA